MFKQQFLKKLVLYSTAIIGGLFVVSLAIIIYVFLNLGNYQKQIDHLIYKSSGYHLQFSRFDTGFNTYLEPHIAITNLTIYGLSNTTPLIKINKINIALSYLSLIKLMPVVDYLQIDGASISLEYDKNDNILINKQKVTNLATKSSSNFDFENLLLNQGLIDLKNIHVTVIDSKHDYLKPLPLNDIHLVLNNSANQHNLAIDLKIASKSHLEIRDSWIGGKFSEFSKWKYAKLTINSLSSQGYQINLTSEVKDGELDNLAATFDSNQQHLAHINENAKNLTNFSGEINIKHPAQKEYVISGKDLTINTTTGYLFNKSNLAGKYNANIGGHISLKELNFAGINSLLKLHPATAKLKLSGLSSCQLNWQGNITKPKDISFIADFNNITLVSLESNIPSINNISANLLLKESSGSLGLNLTNSSLSYPKQFSHHLSINSFKTNTTWQIESQNKLNLSWQNTTLQTPDFLIKSQGSYQQESNFINVYNQIASLNLAKISLYLPRSIPKTIIKYIEECLKSGKLNNGNLIIRGRIDQFPFKQNTGVIKFNGDINNVSYKFISDWGPATNLNAKINLDNSTINLNLNSGNIGDVKLAKSNINLTNWTNPHSILHITATAKGSTSNYLEYLLTTPFKSQITQISNKLNIEGSSDLNLKVNVPINQPKQFSLAGRYTPVANNISIKENESLTVQNINGSVNFNQVGLTKSQLKANALDSNLELNILNHSQFEVYSPNLNFTTLLQMAYPPAANLIYGKAATKASYDTKNNHLSIKSNLDGVTIAGVDPLLKPESSTAPLTIDLYQNKEENRISLNYANLLLSEAQMSKNYELKRLQIALGSTATYHLMSPLESTPISVRADLPAMHILDWANILTKLVPTESNNQITTQEKQGESAVINQLNNPTNASSTVIAHQPKSAKGLYPIQVEINSNGFWLKNYNLDAGQANIIIKPDQVSVNIATPDIKGKMNYAMKENNLDIALDKLLFSSANFTKAESTNNATAPVNPAFESNVNILATESQLITSSLESSNHLLLAKNQSESMEMEQQNSAKLALLKIPNTNLAIKHLYLENHYLGALNAEIYADEDSLYLESANLTNQAGSISINGSDNCIGCSDEYTALIIHADIDDFGLLVNKLNQGDIFAGGKGTFDSILAFDGNVIELDPTKMHGEAQLHITKGQLVHVNPGLFGSLLGVISLRSLTSIDQFSLNNFFGKGFAYDNLNTVVLLNNQDLKIKELQLNGQIASLSTFGNLNFANNTIDTYLTLEPRLGGTVATTAGIVTLNPVIGLIVYLGQSVIGEPVNKALAISYHVSGNIESPVLTQTKVSNQLMQNFNSSINIFKNQQIIPLPSN